jgi:sphinganine-1-phosphate aldolase
MTAAPANQKLHVVDAPPAPLTAFPAHARGADALLKEMAALRGEDVDWAGGRCFSLVYSAGAAHTELLQKAHTLFFSENGLNPMAFRSLKHMEHDVVRMTAALLHGDSKTCGTMTSGGTESLLLAVKTARDKAKKEKPWILRPNIVIPTTAHVAFDKGAHYFGVRIKRASVDPRTQRVDPRKMARLIDRNTILIAASAPQYPHGSVDPIEELGRIAQQRGVLFHVDACVGGFILPFLEKLGRPVPLWDFRVPGVTSISADLHKYGYTAKGASVLVHRSMDTLKYQFFIATEFPGGVYASPTIPGTRPGGAIAAAWAGVQALGEDGYLKLAASAIDTCDRLRRGIAQIDGLTLIGEPHSTIVTWGSSDAKVDVYAVADQLEERGWHIDRQQNPACVHLTVAAHHAPVVEEYLKDLAECVAFVRAHPELKSKGNAAMYGMMAKVPVRTMVKSAVQKIMEGMYGPEGKQPDLEGAPADGFVGKLMEKHQDKMMKVFDEIDRAKALLGRLR